MVSASPPPLCSLSRRGARSIMAAQVPEGYINGCGQIVDPKKTGADEKDPIQEHYKKTGFFGAITGAFGDKKTMYCHHLNAEGKFGVREAQAAGKAFSSEDEIWTFLGKEKCCGRFAYDRATNSLKCGPVVPKDHDDTNKEQTCLFVANKLPAPTPAWALK